MAGIRSSRTPSSPEGQQRKSMPVEDPSQRGPRTAKSRARSRLQRQSGPGGEDAEVEEVVVSSERKTAAAGDEAEGDGTGRQAAAGS